MDIGKFLKEYWSILIFIGMVIVSWATITARLAHVEARVEKLETTVDSLEQMRLDIAVIKEKLINIEKRL